MSIYSSEEKDKIASVILNKNKAKGFMHCSYCLKQFEGSQLHGVMTPRAYGMYEASLYPFVFPGGIKEEIVVVWCKRCGRPIWDSRFLTKIK